VVCGNAELRVAGERATGGEGRKVKSLVISSFGVLSACFRRSFGVLSSLAQVAKSDRFFEAFGQGQRRGRWGG
jgi:hypothetical protein